MMSQPDPFVLNLLSPGMSATAQYTCHLFSARHKIYNGNAKLMIKPQTQCQPKIKSCPECKAKICFVLFNFYQHEF